MDRASHQSFDWDRSTKPRLSSLKLPRFATKDVKFVTASCPMLSGNSTIYESPGNSKISKETERSRETRFVRWPIFVRNLTGKVGVGEVETGEIGQSLKPDGGELC